MSDNVYKISKMYSEKQSGPIDSRVEGPQFKDAAQDLAGQIFPDVEFADGEVVSLQVGRERLVPVTELVLRELARIGLVDMDDLTRHLAGNQ